MTPQMLSVVGSVVDVLQSIAILLLWWVVICHGIAIHKNRLKKEG